MLQFARENSARYDMRRQSRTRETLVRRRACSSRACGKGGWVLMPWQQGVVGWHTRPRCAPRRDAAAPSHRCLAVCQVEREERYMREARAVKAERLKAEARGEVWQPPPPPLSGPDALEMTRQVPALKTTTWSLAGF